MHIGLGTAISAFGGLYNDSELYENEVRLCDQAEALGFESIWAVEHHFSDYNMIPNPLQFLTFMAGRTRTAKLGTMAVITPWHDPMRVAEEVAALDVLSGGRFIFGMGRGLALSEFDGFRVPLGESRDRFNEYAETILNALDAGFIESQGPFAPIPRREIRPRPTRPFSGRTYAVSVSPASFKITAKLGLGILIIPQKPWKVHAREYLQYRDAYMEIHGKEPPRPITSGHVVCDEDGDRAREHARHYLKINWDMTQAHYDFMGEHFKTAPGYEYYANMQKMVATVANNAAAEDHTGRQVIGSPDECFDRLMRNTSMLNSDFFVATFSNAGQPLDAAERSMHLFAEKVLPRLKAEGAPEMAAASAAASA
jgi:alkanesulfonate monooxygenase SsuD/methylene tetrahydromethanopterin reductase-like flavin-dependent oxidoreductase (luciferase family)